jgi:hypothetical protein
MTFKETYEKEKQVVLYGQSARFRLVKYAILIPLFTALYVWQGWSVTWKVLLASIVVALFVHFLFRYKTAAWTKSWGPFTPLE